MSKELIKTVEDKNKPSYYSPTAWKDWLITYFRHAPEVDTPSEPEQDYSGPTDPDTALTNPTILETYRKIEKVLETEGEELQ